MPVCECVLYYAQTFTTVTLQCLSCKNFAFEMRKKSPANRQKRCRQAFFLPNGGSFLQCFRYIWDRQILRLVPKAPQLGAWTHSFCTLTCAIRLEEKTGSTTDPRNAIKTSPRNKAHVFQEALWPLPKMCAKKRKRFSSLGKMRLLRNLKVGGTSTYKTYTTSRTNK